MNKPKILIVEDEMITSDHLRRLLGRLGYEVVGISASGASALECIEQTNPDLLLADIGLEGEIDGIEVAARAREEWKIPTVFLTAFSDHETMRRARITEPYGYLVKPFAEQELHATIEIALQQSTLRAGHEQEAKATAQILVRTQEELTAVTARLFRAQEQEREEIARDLHDDIGQRVALLQIDFENLWQKVPPEIRDQHRLEFEQTLRRAGELANAVRSTSHRLHPAMLEDLGIMVALRQLTEDFEERYSTPTRFSARNISEHLGPQISVTIYRVVQEALQNIAKHAGPAMVNIALVGGASTVELSIRDSGKGFDAQHPRRTGLGLISMSERAEAVGGNLKIESRPGKGTRIHVRLPLEPNGFAGS